MKHARHLIPFFALLLLVAAGTRDWFDRWIDATELPSLISETSIEIRDRHGELLRVYTVADGRWRLDVSLDQVDRTYLDMLIAYEDKRFYRHAGVDIRALMRALGQAMVNGRFISGASTLSMQVARLLEESGTGQWQGKLRQMRVALALERRLTKDQILSLYLAHAPYGGNLEGVRAASLAWFGKEPKRLTHAEAALLVALPQSPETRRPDRDTDAARAARARVLARIEDAGILTNETAIAAGSEPMPTQRHAFPKFAPHLSDLVVSNKPLVRRHDLTLDRLLQQSLEGPDDDGAS